MLKQTFSPIVIELVWQKGSIVFGRDPRLVRRDSCGALIFRNLYGNRDSQTNAGWEIDHVIPVAAGGTDHISNLRPLQWYNNVTKTDGVLKCPIRENQ